VAAMSAGAIRSKYVLYIGAGAVAAGGFISLARAIPTIISAFARGISSVGGVAGAKAVPRTEQDLSMKIVLGGSLAIAVAIFAAPVLNIDFLTALLVIAFGFFFVTVSSRITGEIGSSSNPISGMTIATLLLTCGLFVLIGRTGVGYKAMALSTAALVCVAASNGGTISQDLKTGYLVGATPKYQQIAILVGVVTSAVVIGLTMQLFLGSRETFPAVEFKNLKLPVTTQTAKGPDGKVYKVAFVSDEIPTEKIENIATGSYLVTNKGVPVFHIEGSAGDASSYKPVVLPDVVLTATESNIKAPDGSTYAVAVVVGEVPTKIVENLTRGKYLVDDSGSPRFFVSTTVDKVYEYNQYPTAPGMTLKEVPADAPAEMGMDHKMYKVVTVENDSSTVGRGRYLVDPQGVVAFKTIKVEKFDAPKANLFALIIDGTLGGELPWGLVAIGVIISVILELLGVSALSFAVGLYLPIATSAGIGIGGAVRYLVDRKRKGSESEAEAEFSPGMLMASGLIAGGSIAAVAQAGLMTFKVDGLFDFGRFLPAWLVGNLTWWPLMWFIAMGGALYYIGTRNKLPTAIASERTQK
jgi:hypothetical protein